MSPVLVCSRIPSLAEAGYFFAAQAYLVKPVKRFAVYAVSIHLLLALVIAPSRPSQAQVTEEWARRYNNTTVNGNDFATAVAVDNESNVYVTGYSANGNGNVSEYTTVKYDAQGNQIWVKIFNTSQEDKAKAIVVDKGYVYVMGTTGLVKYTTGGNEVWAKNIGGGIPFDAKAKLAVDEQANVYVVKTTGRFEAIYAKYDSSGNRLWEKTYNDFDNPLHNVAVDKQGNVYLTGYADVQTLPDSVFSIKSRDYSTIKIDSSGNQLWRKTYSYLPAQNLDEEARDVVVDEQGNVYVTGAVAAVSEISYATDIGTIKYDAQGNLLWAQRYDASVYDDGRTITVDKQGNVYVTFTFSDGVTTKYNTIKYDAQGNQLWIKSLDEASSVHIDEQENLFTLSESYTTSKYSDEFSLLWRKDYTSSGKGEEYAVAMTIDTQGNVYVTGKSADNNQYYSSYNYVTVKYDALGNQLWARSYNGPANGDDYPVVIAADSQGNVYVSGNSFGGTTNSTSNEYNYDLLTIKYSADGMERWVKRYASPNEGVDKVTDMELDAQGNLLIAGGGKIFKYDSLGNELWIKNAAGNNIINMGAVLAVDAQGNVYISGDLTVYNDNLIIVKYDTEGNEIWRKTFTGKTYNSASDIAVDTQGNIYITGTSTLLNQYFDYESYLTTLKYDKNGQLLWNKYEYSTYSTDPEKSGYALDLDMQGNVYVTGKVNVFGQRSNYITIKYDTGGNQVWKQTYNPSTNTSAEPTDIAVDLQGNAYVTGNKGTIKYNMQGDQLWTLSSNGVPVALQVDALNNVYIAGSSEGSGTFNDILTIKYSQQSEPLTCNASGSILQEIWLNIAGSLVSDIPVNTPPSASYQLTSFETTTNQGNNYGERIRGYLCVPQNGTYTFYIAGDDRSELWLSPDDDPAHKVKIASVPYFTGVRQWDKYPSQKSVAISLAAGKKYYIEALHKEGPYLDNLAVGWQTSPTAAISVIPGNALSPYTPKGEGKISREYWANITGSLVNDIPVNTPPTTTDELTIFETATNAANNYGQRIRGYVHPQVSGNYRFFIAGDDRCELWLSTDDDPAKKTKVASVPYFTGVREWNKYSSQQSAEIYLVAGRKYYMETLHKEGLYSDNLAVGWSLPNQTTISVINGSYLSPFLASPAIARIGVEESTAKKVSLYPNPFESKLTLDSPQAGKRYITVVDNLGRIVYQNAIHVGSELDLAHLKAGVYMIKVSADDSSSQVIKVVKK